mgnify:CR=1 FL=1|jgi:urea-proton symporter
MVISIFYSFTWLISMSMAGGLLLEALSGIPYLAGTSDLITKEIVQKVFCPNLSDAQVRRSATLVTIGLGICTWMICLPRVGTLATVLFFAGPLVGSTIWPIILGLYHERAESRGAFWAMVLGSGAGLWAYFTLGWFTASLIGTAVSMLVALGALARSEGVFEWRRLRCAPGDTQGGETK